MMETTPDLSEKEKKRYLWEVYRQSGNKPVENHLGSASSLLYLVSSHGRSLGENFDLV